MNLSDFLPLLGKSPDHPMLRAHMLAQGVQKQPHPTPDEGMAFAKFSALGYDLRFDLEGTSGKVFLSSVQVFPNGDGEHCPFAGDLPDDLQAGERREAWRARLGTPTETNEIFCIDMWRKEGYELCVTFDEDDGTVVDIQYNLPRPT